MAATIDIYQTTLLGRCLDRLSDYVYRIFPSSRWSSIPTKDQISGLILRIQEEEIEADKLHRNLMLLVLHEIGKVLLLLAERAEYQIYVGLEACQVTAPANPSQLRNFALYQHLREIHTRIFTITSSLPPPATDVLFPSLSAIHKVACDSVTSLFKSMHDRLNSFILQIHAQNFCSYITDDSSIDCNASSYMDDLKKSTILFRNEFLSKLIPSSTSFNIINILVHRIASCILTSFIRHASLVRPLSESENLQMARDMAELEFAVGQNLCPVEQLGAPYSVFQAFRPMIFLKTSQLQASSLLIDLPPSVILHNLYSRGHDELQSPMQRNKLTQLQYSLWLDSRGEDQVWKHIMATLDDYEMEVRSRGDKELNPVYLLMLQIRSTISSQ